MIGAAWIISAIWFLMEYPRPYSKGMWWRQWGWLLIVFLSAWLWACDEPNTITETEYVDRDVFVTEPYSTRTVYNENLGEFIPEQQSELTAKRIHYDEAFLLSEERWSDMGTGGDAEF